MHSEANVPPEAAVSAAVKGLHLVSAEHRRRWEQGLLSLREIAEEAGVRKQSVHALAKRQGWTRAPSGPSCGGESNGTIGKLTTAPPSPSVSSTQAPVQGASEGSKSVKDPTTVEIPRTVDQLAAGIAGRDLPDLQLRMRQAFIQLYLYTIQEATAFLVRERGNHGPQSLRAIASIVARAQDQLTALGLVGDEAATEQPVQLAVRVYTPEQEADIRRQVEQDAEELRGPGSTEPPAVRSTLGAETSQPIAVLEKAPAGPYAIICEPLPDASSFRDWLEMLGYRYGARHLRDISSAIGGVDHRDREALVKEILMVTNSDPQRLVRLLKEAP